MLVRAGRDHSFPHLSFQEYFASRALATPDMVAANEALKEYLGGDDWWRDVLEFYLLGTARPFRIDWWIYDHRGYQPAGATTERVDFLYSVMRSRFPDRAFD